MKRRTRAAGVLVGLALLLISGAPDGPPGPGPYASIPTGASWPASAAASAVPGGMPVPGWSGPAAVTSRGWTVTIYYTAVEQYHSGRPARVTGCPTIDCTHGGADLGSYPADFVAAVKDEGTGRTAAGRYLNWSSDTGYWLDSAPRDTAGRPLRPFESAAADRNTLVAGSRFTIADCGREEGGGSIAVDVCVRLRSVRWVITDEFTPGLGGPRHVDVYIGEETGPGFTGSSWYTTLVNASLSTTRP